MIDKVFFCNFVTGKRSYVKSMEFSVCPRLLKPYVYVYNIDWIAPSALFLRSLFTKIWRLSFSHDPPPHQHRPLKKKKCKIIKKIVLRFDANPRPIAGTELDDGYQTRRFPKGASFLKWKLNPSMIDLIVYPRHKRTSIMMIIIVGVVTSCMQNVCPPIPTST